jgi:hypothetical protein
MRDMGATAAILNKGVLTDLCLTLYTYFVLTRWVHPFVFDSIVEMANILYLQSTQPDPSDS